MFGPFNSLPSGAPAFSRISATGTPAYSTRVTLLIGDADCLPLKCRNVGDAEVEMIWHLASDAEGYRVRRLRKHTRRRA